MISKRHFNQGLCIHAKPLIYQYLSNRIILLGYEKRI